MPKGYKLPSVMKHQFSNVPEANIPRSSFNRAHGYKTMFDSGYLIPFLVDEVLPGDTFKVDTTMICRMTSALTVPVMDNLFLDTFYFFVPNRLVWSNFQKFMGEQEDPSSSTDYTVPVLAADDEDGFVVGELADYFGLPTDIVDLEVNSLPFRAYNLIWNEWFRDQNLQDSVTVDKDDGPDDIDDYVLLKRSKRHDYFTSCLPWPQKGDAVSIPLSGDAPVTGIGITTAYNFGYGSKDVHETGTIGSTVNYPNAGAFYGNGEWFAKQDSDNAGYPDIVADLSAVSAADINDLREAFQLQKLLERDARGGTRYTEIVRSHFNVISPDARLQRPEFLGGKSTPIMINPVQQTGETNDTPQGNLAAYAAGINRGDGFVKSFTEHGYIIGLCMVRADLTYQQGIDRMWSRSTKYDFYWPALAHLGEQAVLMKEIYAVDPATDTDTDGTPDNEEVFGYQERYAEYRYKPSHITGKLRSTYATSLDLWHLAQEFETAPSLSDSFIQENPPIDRVIAVTDEPEFVMDCFIKMDTVRPMPVYSVPGLIDHF